MCTLCAVPLRKYRMTYIPKIRYRIYFLDSFFWKNMFMKMLQRK